MGRPPFNSIFRHGFVRVAVCIPAVRLGNPHENAVRALDLAQRAHQGHAAVALFPELGLSGYSNEDLFHQDALLEVTRSAFGRLVEGFFETSQFKRSALPNAPKVGSGGSLSPRSDWRAPSDGHADAWLEELEREVPTVSPMEES